MYNTQIYTKAVSGLGQCTKNIIGKRNCTIDTRCLGVYTIDIIMIANYTRDVAVEEE